MRAHDAVLSPQAPLLLRNPRCPRPPSYPRRGAGQPTRLTKGSATSRKALALPSVLADGIDDAWLELALVTVERAFDRWAWAQHHAARTAFKHQDVRQAVVLLLAAWSNYWQLAEELDRLRG
jgi:hypothetical protein